ncbi:MAG: sigma-70 family RNA polymerase sigma factor [Lachnospiraceae bacterium]|nr:sigma-70 family RNA polymerase sigma factor [Lachnospiraceae bacterium]
MDRTEYEKIAEENLDMVYRIALSHTGKEADADDVVQQTFYKLLASPGKFADEEHVKRWLIRVCINECNSMFSGFWRKNVQMFSQMASREEKAEYDPGQALSGGEYGQEDPVFAQQEKRELLEALGNLPPVLRSVLYLFYYEGYKTREIAQILHVREATVRTRLVRGRKLLREELKEA